ncbi:MAG: ATP synthase F0 subunit B [Syntrophorhabdaceae bacterium]|nr:ATP synthase F0 subunit B [Syntrophorhabdaceae bacterium]
MIEFNYTILVQFLNFLILMILLNQFLFKPLSKAISKRGKKIDSFFETSKAYREEAEGLLKTYEETMRDKKRPVVEMKDSLVSDGRRRSMELIDQAKSEMAEELSRLRETIEIEKKKTYEALQADLDRLSADAAKKILKRSLT